MDIKGADTLNTSSLEHRVDITQPILDQLPEYQCLRDAEVDKSVELNFTGRSGNTYGIEVACMYTDNGGTGEYVFGMWEKKDKKLVPVGLLSCGVNSVLPHVANINVSLASYLQGDEKFCRLDEIASEGGDDALRIAKLYQREGFAQLLIAISYAVLEARGIEKVEIFGDSTKRPNHLAVNSINGDSPIVAGTVNYPLSPTSTIIQPEAFSSLYAQFATRDNSSFDDLDPFADTIVSTHISGPQVTMLLEAIKEK